MEKIDFKMIKALQERIVQNGPRAPFTGEIMNNISDSILTPSDWYNLARATLNGGDYLL